MTVSAEPSAALPFNDPSRRSRLIKIALWLVGIALAIVLLNLLGVDVIGWLRDPSSLKPTAHMPKLTLSDAEVQALAAYLDSLR